MDYPFLETKILERDLDLFKDELESYIKPIFPIDSLGLIISKNENVIPEGLDISPRQRERAKRALLHGKGFWDRVNHQIFIPLGDGKKDKEDILGIFQINGVPKNIGAEEGKWLIGLLEKALEERLVRLKEDSLKKHINDSIPEYIKRLIKKNNGLDLVEISFFDAKISKKKRSFFDFLLSVFNGGLDFLGRDGGTFWFLISQKTKGIKEKAKKLGLFLSKNTSGLRDLLIYENTKCLEDIDLLKRISNLLGARIFCRAFYNELSYLFGVDLGKVLEIKFPIRKNSILGIISQDNIKNSLKTQERLKNILKKADIEEISGKDFIFHLFFENKNDVDIRDYCNEIFKDLSTNLDGPLVCGFSSPLIRHVTERNLNFSALFALYHARLLGPSNFALFDHLTFNVMGDLLHGMGQIRGAISFYKKGLSLKPNDINLLNSLGASLAEIKRLAEAKTYFEQVLRLKNNDEMALYNLSGIFCQKKEFERAEELIDKVIKRKKAPSFFIRKLEILLGKKDFEKALLLSRRLFEQKEIDKNCYVLRLIAKASFYGGDWELSKKALSKILKVFPNDAFSLIFLSKGFLEFDKDVATSRKFFEKINKNTLKNSDLKGLYTGLFKVLDKM